MDNEEIVIEEGTGFKRAYTYQPYTYHRIVEILKEYCNAYLYPIIWYKCGRSSGYRQRYHVKEIGTDKLIRSDVYLDDLREIFARLDIPLHKSNRNPKAEAFLQIVNDLTQEEHL